MRVLAVAGSLRRGSFNRALLKVAAEVAPQGMTVVEHAIDDLPMFNQDLEVAGDPPPVAALKAAIAAADALLLALPEYNHSVSGVAKNALDWASRRLPETRATALAGKSVALMSAGGSAGGVRAQEHAAMVLTKLDARLVDGPRVAVAQARARFDADGNLQDAAVRAGVAALMVALRDTVIAAAEPTTGEGS